MALPVCTCLRGLLHGSGLLHEILEYFVQTDVATSNQEVQIVKAGWLVLDENEKQVDGQSHKHLLLASLVDGTNIRHTVARDVIADDNVDQAYEQVLAVLRAFVRKVRAERVENQQILVGRVEKRLA